MPKHRIFGGTLVDVDTGVVIAVDFKESGLAFALVRTNRILAYCRILFMVLKSKSEQATLQHFDQNRIWERSHQGNLQRGDICLKQVSVSQCYQVPLFVTVVQCNFYHF